MKTPCPRCRRGTAIEDDIGDFPIRCERCGALLRRHAASPSGTEEVRTSGVIASRTIRRGSLAGLLSRSSAAGSAAIADTDTAVAVSPSPGPGVLRPESRREIARAHARQQALEQAQLRGSHQAFGVITWAGVILAVLMGIGAAVLKAQAIWQHPTPGRGDIVRDK
jgi:hypothetical protein